MKLLIGAVVALLCMQTIKAFPQAEKVEDKSEVKGTDKKGEDKCEDKCEKELKIRKDEVESWFLNVFGHTHDKAQSKCAAVVKTCKQLTKNLNDISCTRPTECQIAKFLKIVYRDYLDAQEDLTEFLYLLSELDVKSDKHRCDEKQVCKKNCEKGCEADTNKEVCDLIDFHYKLDDAVVQAKNLTINLLKSCDVLYDETRKYDCKNKPSCHGKGCDKGCSCDRCRHNGSKGEKVDCFVNGYLPKFTFEHGVAHGILLQLNDICTKLGSDVAGWTSRTI